MAPGARAMAVAIVNYNTRELLRGCLASIRRASPREVVVVDNASTDGSAEMVGDTPGVVLLANRENVGYGAAANQAIARCRAPYVLLLNADTRIEDGALDALARYLDEHPWAAVVGPRLVRPGGALQASCYPFPTLASLVAGNSVVGRFLRWVPLLRDRNLRVWPHSANRVVPWVLGAAVAIRRCAFEAAGGFDESFFMYGEEMDLCYRLSRAGWEIHFAPVTTVSHFGGASTALRRTDMAVQLFSSLRLFYRRHYSRLGQLVLAVLVMGLALARWLIDSARLSIEADSSHRRRLAQDVAAWRRILLGHW